MKAVGTKLEKYAQRLITVVLQWNFVEALQTSNSIFLFRGTSVFGVAVLSCPLLQLLHLSLHWHQHVLPVLRGELLLLRSRSTRAGRWCDRLSSRQTPAGSQRASCFLWFCARCRAVQAMRFMNGLSSFVNAT